MKSTEMKITDLQQSNEILEIRPVNTFFVSRYRQAMRNGDEFPPLVINEEDNTIVSGNHTYQAILSEFGEKAMVKVEKRSYDSFADMIEDSVRENAKHGNPLDGISRRRAAIKLVELGKEQTQVAQLLGVSVKRIEEWGDMTVYVVGGDKKKTPRPHKRGADLTGKTISEDKYNEHIKKDRGVSVSSQAAQLARYIENGWVDMHDLDNIQSLRHLRDQLNQLDLSWR